MPDSYAPRRRTGVVLCGAGTAGAYHAGVLRALHEAGVKVDVLAAHGAGIIMALASAVDGGARLWDPAGPWTDPRLRGAYRWRPALRAAGFGLLVAVGLLLSPLVMLLFAAVVYAASVAAALVNLTPLSVSLVGGYRRLIEMLFDPPVLPTIIPRAVVLAVLVVVAVLIAAAFDAARHERSRRRMAGSFWWRLIGSPLDAREPGGTLADALWRLVRGASNEPRPATGEIGRRLVDVLADNFGQPGFREVMVAVHDLDARRDLVAAVLPAASRAAFETKPGLRDPREAEIVDFTGPQRELVLDFLMAGLRLPIATAPWLVEFPAASYWRGERHRLCDRPELVGRLVDELVNIGIEQVILVSPAPPPALPNGMRSRPVDLRARSGELLRSIETAALEDGLAAAAGRCSSAFVIRPDHNPIGPFDFAGCYDEASDRRRTIAELMQQGYADAYRHFIDPFVAAGERQEV
jgi:hypothetical protein